MKNVKTNYVDERHDVIDFRNRTHDYSERLRKDREHIQYLSDCIKDPNNKEDKKNLIIQYQNEVNEYNKKVKDTDYVYMNAFVEYNKGKMEKSKTVGFAYLNAVHYIIFFSLLVIVTFFICIVSGEKTYKRSIISFVNDSFKYATDGSSLFFQKKYDDLFQVKLLSFDENGSLKVLINNEEKEVRMYGIYGNIKEKDQKEYKEILQQYFHSNSDIYLMLGNKWDKSNEYIQAYVYVDYTEEPVKDYQFNLSYIISTSLFNGYHACDDNIFENNILDSCD